MPGVTLEIRTSPHLVRGTAVETIMWNVVLALLPVVAFAVYAFGLAALLTVAAAVASCVAAEHAFRRAAAQPSTVSDGSVAITGLLYGLTLPPTLPLWMTVLGGIVAVGLGKALFGGLGKNAFNPALVGRAVLQGAFPAAMTTWAAPFADDRFGHVPRSLLALPLHRPEVDAVTAATPLAAWKFEQVAADPYALAMGLTSGSVGETSAVLIALGGVYLAARRMLNWRIPASILATVGALSGALHLVDPTAYASPVFMWLSGGLMLGAVFMATDMVASPMTALGVWVYGALIGLLVVVIRVWGGMPEGVMYAILLANAVGPHIDGWIRPRPFGARRRREQPA